MSGPITAVFKITDANDDFEKLFRQMNAASRDEEGTLTHRMFRQDDGTVRMYEDYASSEAFLEHTGNAMESGLLNKVMAACTIKELVILGEPTAAAREAMAPMGAVIAPHVGGFSKLGRQEQASR